MAALPTPAVTAMVAGVLSPPSAPAFPLATLVPRVGAVLPPVVAAVLEGAVAVGLTGAGEPVVWPGTAFAVPVLQAPTFYWAATAELALHADVVVLSELSFSWQF